MKPSVRLFVLTSLLATSLWVVIWLGISTQSTPVAAAPSCRLTFLDVGQGDAILLQTPDHQDLVIDGGPSADVSRHLGKYLHFGNNEVEMLILTHPDADHLTGALSIVREWPVKTILTTGVVAETKLWQRWHEATANHGGVITGVQRGQRYTLGKFLTVDIVWPDRSWADIPYTAKASNGRGGINDTSIGTTITCAGSTFLTIGDASDAVEEKVLLLDDNLRADLLRVGHHGSKYSSGHGFLQAVQPDLAVITVGAQNRYGHPHPTVLLRLETLHIPIYRTDLQGTLVFRSVAGGWGYTP